jgi:dynein heavy chain, axonemal
VTKQGDIVEVLAEAKVTSINNFNWQQQLRYYWDTQADDCRIKQVSRLR